jgi:hypothetical protein
MLPRASSGCGNKNLKGKRWSPSFHFLSHYSRTTRTVFGWKLILVEAIGHGNTDGKAQTSEAVKSNRARIQVTSSD